MQIGILGDGAWGTTLAILLAKAGCSIKVWGYDPIYAAELNKTRVNSRYLPGVNLPEGIDFTPHLEEAVVGKDFVVLAVPTRFIPDVVENLRALSDNLPRYWCIASKGLIPGRAERVSSFLNGALGLKDLAVLSGPCIAKEVAKGLPTAVVCAADDLRFCRYIQGVFNSDRFRVYTSQDVIGVEMASALKNVIAIAAGLADGMGVGINAKSALLARAIAEITRLGTALGGQEKTFRGIAGLGDMLTTCFSPSSRNRSFGEAIAKGARPDDLLATAKQAIEGAYTVKEAAGLANAAGIDMPITDVVYRVVYGGLAPAEAVKALMSRQLKEED